LAKALEVLIIGKAEKYVDSLKESEHATSKFGSGFKKMGVAAAAGGVAVAAVAVEIGKKTLEAAISAQEANDKLTQSFKNQGLAMNATSPAVLKLEQASRELGFSNNDTREGLTKLVNSGKSYKDSVSEITVAQDLARVKGISLGDATSGLIKLQTGATRAAKEYGIVLPPVTTAQDKLKASKVDLTTQAGKELLAHAKIQDKLATGQAYYDALSGKVKDQGKVFSESAEGGMAKFHASLGNIEETIGAKLLPSFSTAIQGVDKFLNFVTGAGSASDKFKTALEKMGLSSTQAGEVVKRAGEIIHETIVKIKEIVTGTLDFLSDFWKRWGDTIKQVVGIAFDFISGTIRNAFQVIKGIFEVFHGLLTGDWSQLWKGLKDIFGGISAQIVNVVKTWWSLVEVEFRVAWSLLEKLALDIAAAIVEPFSHLPGKLGHWARAAKDGIQEELNKVNAKTAADKIIADLNTDRVHKAGVSLGRSLMSGLASGIGKEEGEAMVASALAIDKVIASAHAAAGKPNSPAPATIPLGKSLFEGVAAGIDKGVSVAMAAAARGMDATVKTLSSSAVKALGNAGSAIIAAAKKVGVDARAALAVAMTEGGTSFGAVGDKGTSFGPFQLHIGGANPYGDPAKAAAFANSIKGIAYALRLMSEAGAKGKSGFDAISEIVRNFEKPADPSGEIRKAIAYYKTLPAEIGKASVDAAVMTGAQVKAAVTKAGADLARDTEAQIKAQLKKIGDAKATFSTAFGELANAALAAFDAKMAAWKPPSGTLLDAYKLQDQITQLTAGLGPAVTTAQSRLAAAFSSGNKEAIDQAQNDLNAALTNSYNAVDFNTTNMLNAAQATLAQAQAEGDPDKIATAQAAYDQALTDRTAALNQNQIDQRALIEQNLQWRADAEQRTHDAIAAKQREGLAKQLAQLQTWLLKHPAEWAKMAGKVQGVLGKYNIQLQDAGHAWADKFAAGVTAGIPAAVKAAHALAAAVAAVLPSKKSPLRPAKEGPLAFHPYEMGKEWASSLGSGLAAGGIQGAMGTMAARPTAALGTSGGGGTTTVHVHVAGTVVSENQLVEAVYRGLVRKSRRNAGNLGLA
jgi:hypothetical protein